MNETNTRFRRCAQLIPRRREPRAASKAYDRQSVVDYNSTVYAVPSVGEQYQRYLVTLNIMRNVEVVGAKIPSYP